jgi:hypothetical protein
MSVILSLLAFLFSLGGLFYWIQTRRMRESQAGGPLRARPAQGRAPAAEGPQAKLSRITGHFPAFRKAEPRVDAKANTGLQGNLAETPLHDFLQYLSLGRKAGILELVSGRRAGRLVFQGGKVYKASFRGKEGLEAVFLMLDLPEGDFEFHEQALDDAPAQHPLEVVDIIMLWMDRKPKKKQAQR